MTEHEPRPRPADQRHDAAEHEAEPQSSIESIIETGITAAQQEGREIELTTARAIADALGKAIGEDSALARFANSGVGGYLALREEYLDLYNDPDTPAEAKRWIDWLGTFLVQREGTGSSRSYTTERSDPDLEHVLVKTALPMQGGEQRAHVPATLSAKNIIGLAARLESLEEYQDSAFRAYLTLPDVDAASPDLLESFRENYVGSWPFLEDAVRELAELDSLEDDLIHLVSSHGLPENAVTIEYEVIEQQLREVYDIVSEGWQIHAFHK